MVDSDTVEILIVFKTILVNALDGTSYHFIYEKLPIPIGSNKLHPVLKFFGFIKTILVPEESNLDNLLSKLKASYHWPEDTTGSFRLKNKSSSKDNHFKKDPLDPLIKIKKLRQNLPSEGKDRKTIPLTLYVNKELIIEQIITEGQQFPPLITQLIQPVFNIDKFIYFYNEKMSSLTLASKAITSRRADIHSSGCVYTQQRALLDRLWSHGASMDQRRQALSNLLKKLSLLNEKWPANNETFNDVIALLNDNNDDEDGNDNINDDDYNDNDDLYGDNTKSINDNDQGNGKDVELSVGVKKPIEEESTDKQTILNVREVDVVDEVPVVGEGFGLGLTGVEIDSADDDNQLDLPTARDNPPNLPSASATSSSSSSSTTTSLLLSSSSSSERATNPVGACADANDGSYYGADAFIVSNDDNDDDSNDDDNNGDNNDYDEDCDDEEKSNKSFVIDHDLDNGPKTVDLDRDDDDDEEEYSDNSSYYDEKENRGMNNILNTLQPLSMRKKRPSSFAISSPGDRSMTNFYCHAMS